MAKTNKDGNLLGIYNAWLMISNIVSIFFMVQGIVLRLILDIMIASSFVSASERNRGQGYFLRSSREALPKGFPKTSRQPGNRKYKSVQSVFFISVSISDSA